MLAGLAVGLVLAEALLRLGGFQHAAAPRLEDPIKRYLEEPAFVPDAELFWVDEGYSERLRRARAERPALALMGDSCTEDGSYVEPLARLAAGRAAGGRLSHVNLGVGAWSSHQGLGQLRRDVVPLGVKVATLFFGWNDHWNNNQLSDREAAEMMRGRLMGRGSLRLVQLARKAWQGAVGRSRAGGTARLRVPLPEFRDNLQTMIRVARRAGIVPVLITAPTANRPEDRPPPADGSERPPDLKGQVHLQYVAAVRAVAREKGAALCDLQRRFAALPPAQLAASFTGDGIHFSAEGGSRAAGWLRQCLEREGLWARVVEVTARF